MNRYSFDPVAIVESVFQEKFGVPRQPGLAPAACARLRLREPHDRPEYLAGIDQFSHLWLVFVFHLTAGHRCQPTVRPPRLGGNRRVGVFASRSTHRPNPLGLSVVRLLDVGSDRRGPYLDLGGADLVDGTPVLDIKPYLPYADSVIEARAGVFTQAPEPIPVILTDGVRVFCHRYRSRTGHDLQTLLLQVLGCDPRPAYQNDDKRRYGMALGPVEVEFRVVGTARGCEVRVESVKPRTGPEVPEED